MKGFFAFLFIVLTGVMVGVEGWWDLLLVPLGYFISLFIAAQVILFPLLGIPRAIRLVSKKQMRGMVFVRILRTPFIWIAGIIIVGFLFGWIFPRAALYLYDNKGFNYGGWLGIFGIIFSTLSKSDRADFYKDFERACFKYYLPEFLPKLETDPNGNTIIG